MSSAPPPDLSLAIGLLQKEITSKRQSFKISASAAETHRQGWEREMLASRRLEQSIDELEATLAKLIELQDPRPKGTNA